MKQERQVLVIFPHPDDEAFGVSGTISAHRAQGTPVTYACLTLGEMGRNLGNPPFATRESLPKIRKNELLQAAQAMDIQDLRMMRLRDKTLEFEEDEKLKQMVIDLVEELNPSLVISFYPGYSVHPDHEATARAVVAALAELPPAKRPVLHCLAFSNGHEEEIGEPDMIHDVSAYAEQKKDAMRAHLSQTAWMLADMEPKWNDGDPEALAWLQRERFWTYRFDD
ncbi:bacillithiol biosynthesis deacetylase BshB2 [Alkalicoccobacillus porphyridii]|uniref:Bacillithiol biosynthesis deacetylase BshB2 n=1 Tax=Alkalicoccobacillus porphyridii TaxID=2597270 RepID=A0A554A0D7_9BACI|nr:bacillithiol biosynthesis deacetylase BshB2 [Alkalicoccobacillus porphyridii]TSB47162.1 bacillithiol biosynthesis deacetylase BshB2 [Alkalicoccobacillus porphyridii]